MGYFLVAVLGAVLAHIVLLALPATMQGSLLKRAGAFKRDSNLSCSSLALSEVVLQLVLYITFCNFFLVLIALGQ